MNYEQIKEVAAVFEASPTLTEIDLRGAGIALRLRRAAPAAKKPALPVAAPAVPAAPVSAFGDVLAGAASADLDEPAAAEGNTLITAHMVGVFRAARSGKNADAAPAAPGDLISEGQALGSVETMRILNECPAPVSGVIQSVFVSDGQPVEYGQALFEIAPVSASPASPDATPES